MVLLNESKKYQTKNQIKGKRVIMYEVWKYS